MSLDCELQLEDTNFLDGALLLQQMHASKVHDDTTKRVLGATSGGAGVSSELKHDGGVLSPTVRMVRLRLAPKAIL